MSISLTTAELSEESQELVSSTVQAVSSEDFASLDMRSILGEALFSLSSSMGIDVSQEVAQSGAVKKEIQVKVSFYLYVYFPFVQKIKHLNSFSLTSF